MTVHYLFHKKPSAVAESAGLVGPDDLLLQMVELLSSSRLETVYPQLATTARRLGLSNLYELIALRAQHGNISPETDRNTDLMLQQVVEGVLLQQDPNALALTLIYLAREQHVKASQIPYENTILSRLSEYYIRKLREQAAYYRTPRFAEVLAAHPPRGGGSET